MKSDTVLELSPPAVHYLSETDARQAIDQAIRHGWMEMARRALRIFVLVLTDIFASIGAASAVLGVRSSFWPDLSAGAVHSWSTFLMAVCIQPLALSATGAYRSGESRVSLSRVVMGLSLAVAVAGVQAYLVTRLESPFAAEVLALVAYLTCAAVVIFAVRMLIDRAVSSAYSLGIGRRRALVVGSPEELESVAEMLRDRNGANMRIMGRISPTYGRDSGAIQNITEIDLALEATEAREVIVASSKLSFEVLETLIRRCSEHGAVVSLAPKTLHLKGMQVELREVRGGTLLRVQPIGLRFPQLAVKRAIDLALGTLALVLTAPVFLLVALAIKLDSPGPVFFKQVRAGVGGRLFRMWKFRSMYVDAEEREKEFAHLNIYEGGTFKIRDDPRVTRVGRILRRTSLDELPQLLNVLQGEMSLVGPRPALVGDLKRYKPHHYERLSVVPGMTGPWQVGGRNLITDFETILEMERGYIRNWSLALDAKILLRTVAVVVRGEGAY